MSGASQTAKHTSRHCAKPIEIGTAPASRIIFAGHPDEDRPIRTDVTSSVLLAVADHVGMGNSLTIRPGKSRLRRYPAAFTITVEPV